MGVRGEIDKSGWHLIKPSRKEAKYYQMNLSFMEMESLVDVEKAVFLCHPPQGANAPQEPGPRNLKHSSIRLNNNAIVELCGEGANVIDKEGVDLGPPPSLEMALSHVVADLSMIRWIDLSFNSIRVFGDCFKCMPSLQVLNLQANRIGDLKQVKRLGELPKLKKLSLFGNPIEEKKHYRSYVITVCPLVGQLDFSVVTNQERDTAAGWAFTFRRKLNPEEKEEK